MPETREIPLTQGQVAIVSAEDYEYLIQWRWQAQGFQSKGLWYAIRSETVKLSDGTKKRPTIRMHRSVLFRVLGHEDFREVDHIDGDGLNNQRSNLRPATQKENQENRNRPNKNSMSGVRGVSWNKFTRRWLVQIGHNGENIKLGEFEDIAAAEKAAIAARNELFTHH